MRIAYLTWHGRNVTFGADISIHRLAVTMSSKGHDVHIFHTYPGEASTEMSKGVVIHSCHRGSFPLLGKMEGLMAVLRAFSLENRRKQFDMVHINGPSLGIGALMIGSAPVVYKDVDIASAKESRGDGKGLFLNAIHIAILYAIEFLAVRAAYTIFVSSAFSMKEFAARYPSCEQKIAVVPPAGLEPEWFSEQKIPWEERIVSPRFLFIGAFQRRLAEVFVLALKHLGDSGLKVAGILVREENDKARNLAAELGVEMEYHSNVPADSLRSSFSSSLAYILPSVREGFCIPLVEAGSSGTPSIVYDIPHIRDFISDGRNGVVMKDMDPVAWAGVMKRMMSDRGYWTALSNGARERAARYRMENIAASIENCYEAFQTAWKGKTRKAGKESKAHSGEM